MLSNETKTALAKAGTAIAEDFASTYLGCWADWTARKGLAGNFPEPPPPTATAFVRFTNGRECWLRSVQRGQLPWSYTARILEPGDEYWAVGSFDLDDLVTFERVKSNA